MRPLLLLYTLSPPLRLLRLVLRLALPLLRAGEAARDPERDPEREAPRDEPLDDALRVGAREAAEDEGLSSPKPPPVMPDSSARPAAVERAPRGAMIPATLVAYGTGGARGGGGGEGGAGWAYRRADEEPEEADEQVPEKDFALAHALAAAADCRSGSPEGLARMPGAGSEAMMVRATFFFS